MEINSNGKISLGHVQQMQFPHTVARRRAKASRFNERLNGGRSGPMHACLHVHHSNTHGEATPTCSSAESSECLCTTPVRTAVGRNEKITWPQLWVWTRSGILATAVQIKAHDLSGRGKVPLWRIDPGRTEAHIGSVRHGMAPRGV